METKYIAEENIMFTYEELRNIRIALSIHIVRLEDNINSDSKRIEEFTELYEKVSDLFKEMKIKKENLHMNRVNIVMKALEVEREDALKIIEHLTKHDCLDWIDDYDEDNRDEQLVDVHYEDNFEDMIDWQYEDYTPSQMLGMSDDIEDHEAMLELEDKVIFWYGLV